VNDPIELTEESLARVGVLYLHGQTAVNLKPSEKDALRAFGDMNITVKFLSPIRPFTLEPTETELDFIQLITPVRTN